MKKPLILFQKLNNGFTLVELMVALLVLAIGLLGLAGLQAKGLSNNHNAYLRTQATLLAQDMADRMRGNRAALTSYLDGETSDTCCYDGSSGINTQMAGCDLKVWNDTLENLLPGATGTITKSGDIYTIQISWSERQNDSYNAHSTITKSQSMSFQP